MANSNKVVHELRAAVQKMNQALRGYGSGRPDPKAAADCFNRLMAAISDIDERLVVLEEAQKARSVSDEAP
ncbi:hypothetical protein SAMN03159444_01431 [Pseudomonas sp. NFACC02]|uniref:hypothetical protein n=1 Tax=Pseudomonas sp. NFACC02 TaxID=1566250 RepID=UPI0008D5011E|nr:hypothetical protein [Pseudomonas sp. NFACC02]SEQ29255.1 hypothetical protein SAMN03159444_01431 [Pseudomonas sp. NFACC02]